MIDSCFAAAQVPTDAEAVAVPVFADLALPPGSPEVDPGYCAARGFTGKVGEALPLPSGDGAGLVAVGLGAPGEVDAEALRRAAAAFVRAAWRRGSGAFPLRGTPSSLSVTAAAQAVAEGAQLASYRFTTYKAAPETCALSSLAVVADGDGGQGQDDPVGVGVRRGGAVARAVALARDLVNEPAGALTPTRLAEIAVDQAGRGGLEVSVWDETRIAAEGLGGLQGVARGSNEPPRLIRLAYEPSAGTSPDRPVPTVALVGKGITFDSGGLSIKPAEGMMTMKTDMSGAAAVLATLSAVAELGVPVRVLGFLPTTENMPGGSATKPGDVLRIRNGKTIEVLNTDAEGRLVLADGLSLAVEENVDAIVDLATLTGACVVALGGEIAGLMGTDEGFVGQVAAAAERAGEAVWRLPLPERYRTHIDSEIADMKNIGSGRQAGSLVAGLILSEFVGEVPWAHLDIAGPARSEEDAGYLAKGGTGYGVRTLLELLGEFTVPA